MHNSKNLMVVRFVSASSGQTLVELEMHQSTMHVHWIVFFLSQERP